MDGTFNQTRPLRFASKWPCMYSYDLSSATDRLPISLQRELIAVLYNNIELSNLWVKLLVDRGYKVPKGETLHYSVGQPMGALSSWAMLAVTHHFIIQCAAWRSGKYPIGIFFRRYAILGDDIVIGDKLIAGHYYNIISQLGVKVGLAKSVISHNGLGLEFAKKTFVRGQNVSPIPFKEYAVTSGSLPALIEFSRKYSLSVPNIVKMLGFGYRVLGKLNQKWVFQSVKIRRLLIGLTIPIDDSSFLRWVDQFPKSVHPDTMLAFRALMHQEVSKVSLWMSKTSQFLAHELNSWQKEYAFFVAGYSKLNTPITSKTLPVPSGMRKTLLKDPVSKLRIKFYFDAVSLTFHSLQFRMSKKLQDVFLTSFSISDSRLSHLKRSDRSFFDPFTKYMSLMKIIGNIPDKSFISNTRAEDTLSAKAVRDTLMTKIWVKWAPIISGSMPYQPPASSRDAPMESSLFLFPVSAVFRRIIFTSTTVSQGLLARKLAKYTIPASMFGIRTMIAIWGGEMIFISVLMLTGFGTFYAICTWMSGGQVSMAFAPIILLTSSYFMIVSNFIYCLLFASCEPASYSTFHWLVEIYSLLVAVTVYIDFGSICEAYKANEISSIGEHIGYFTGVSIFYIVNPVWSLVCIPYNWWSGMPFMIALGEVNWAVSIRDLFLMSWQTLVSDFHLLMDKSFTLPALTDMVLDPILPDPVQAESVDNPWGDEDSTPRGPTVPLPDGLDVYFPLPTTSPEIPLPFSNGPELCD
jgi:hypothetical protein